ncbi:MAG: amidohydrolase [Coprococcus sp.]|nr:amidohydrolase [Coprococcus sp.]
MKKQEMYDEVESLAPICQEISRKLWENPETGGDEKESADYLRKLLEEEGFTIVNTEHMEHAFYAEYGSGSPVIAVLGEYDALPGLSQKVCAEKEPVIPGGPGHGCGHNLLGAAAATTAIAVKRFLEKGEAKGTIRFYGCPEEELLSGKVKMAYYHMFDGCDMALSWHPMCANMVYDEGYLASASAKFFFKGRTSHAAFAPEKGRSALDAVELMNVGCNYLREHVVDKTRIHYTTDSGGFAPNIVPDKASAWYFVRAPHISDVKETLARIEKIAQGAALMTETEVDSKIEYGCCDINGNIRFTDLTYENLKEAPWPEYTEEEKEFARKLQEKLDPAVLAREEEIYHAAGMPVFEGICPRDLERKVPLTASSDSGDVSQIMPMNLLTTTCWPVGCAPHTWQAAASTGSSIGEKGALYAARVLAGTAYDLFTCPEVREEIIKEFREKDTGYSPMFEG